MILSTTSGLYCEWALTVMQLTAIKIRGSLKNMFGGLGVGLFAGQK